MAFDPHRDVSVASGAFRVDVNELCATHTLVTYEENLSIGPARLALNAALAVARPEPEPRSSINPQPQRTSL